MRSNSLLLFILTVLFFSLFSACDANNSKSQRTILPDSNGAVDEILIVADPLHLEDSTRKILSNVFSGPYDVLPQYEPRLISRFISYNKMTDLLSRFRTIVIVADLEKKGKARDFTLENVPQQIIDSGERNFYIKKNAWAEPQLIICLFANGQQNLWKAIQSQGDYLCEVIQKYQEPFLKKILFAKGHNYELEKTLREKYHIKMEIPEEYILAQEEDDFLWIRRETTVSSENIMLYFEPYAFEKDIENYGIPWRNKLGKKYISTQIDSTYMTTDNILPVMASIKKINGTEIIENRGLWKVQNDFMGGPFLNYLIPDKQRKRLIMMDAFIHAPGEKKRIFMRKAEVIFNSINLQN
ncbi:MAG: DUF4837 family protein [Chitinophagales bacterium]